MQPQAAGPQGDGAPPAGAILAGGAGRRMGGTVKAGLRLGGETLLARAARRLAPQVPALAVCAGPDPARLAGLLPPGAASLADPLPGYEGPLAALSAALDWAEAEGHADLLTVAVDTPFFPADLATRLAAGRGAAAAALAEDGNGLHPTFGLWRSALAAPLRAALAGGARRMTGFADRSGAVRVRFPGDDTFFNVNAPDDLALAEARL
ncbi:molybdenum cofactor guanylyltransferase [Rhodovulum sp. 12E13]|uniref:molybdenum cofactor guanylyltransferase MobA n=1 Tax=Rhodovulum sp. 12E13 TaxID=2203891 RepID=UPI000E17DEC8|nr:molybdenum cofactor guanylyltransferase MobA [Rhodovulum sp. 12E13]RDC74925.1 molybdenum cofactor guanylyltransferase [Rhodovulum sp. 12E13]